MIVRLTPLLYLGLVITFSPAHVFAQNDFATTVAPILESRCLRCHSDGVKKGGLSLTSSEALRIGGKGGPAIEPGKPDESLLIEKIIGDPPEMPKAEKPLSAEEVATLRRWVESGAPWPNGVTLKDPKASGPWWAIQPLLRPNVPVVKNVALVRMPIDAFVLQTLEAKGLSPRPEADRRTLIRRLTFDLHGLPPSPEEIDAFLHDMRSDAYEQLVDRLLASPRYGERWGRHWLDVVHYGDTHGYDKDKRRENAWRYRDYVIRAFNDDIPYGRFIMEQVAGDVLFPDRPEATVATGFIAAGPWDFVGHLELREGTVDKEKTRLIDRDDMLMNTMSTFESLTVHCARCHDHKFDPIPQRDYYRLQAVFAGVERGDKPVSIREVEARRLASQRRREAASEQLKHVKRKVDSVTSPDLVRLDETIQEFRRQLADVPKAASTTSSPTNGYHSTIRPVPNATAWVQIDLGASMPIDEIRLIPARPTDFPDTPGFGYPHWFRIEVAEDAAFTRPEVIVEVQSRNQEKQADEPYVVRPGGRKARVVRISASRLWKRTDDYVFALSEVEILSSGKNVAAGATVSALDSIEAGRWSKASLVDGFDSRGRRPAIDDAVESKRDDLIFRIHEAERERERRHFALIDPTLRLEVLRAEVESAESELAEAGQGLAGAQPLEMVYAVVPRAPRPIRVLRRGEVEQPGEEVEPGALSCLPGLESSFAASADEGARRAALARWIADPKNVLTWRSIVNRVWLGHFGRGIVETPSDFGRNGALPTHPELLDWLATEFLAQGQSIKALHRVILSSSTYRRASTHDNSCATIDAENRYYWRMNRRRLDAESIRDAALAVSGELDLKIGGPAYQPFRFKDDHSPIYDHEALDRINAPETRRRTVYRFTVRSVPDPFLDSLDCADPNANVPIRNTTLTAPQALALLNDPFMVRQSERFAHRLSALGRESGAEVDAAFGLAFGRLPTADERAALAAYAKQHGMANACRVLLNTNEFGFVD